MKAETTDIKAADNINGYYCGACHDGKRVFEVKRFLLPALSNSQNRIKKYVPDVTPKEVQDRGNMSARHLLKICLAYTAI